MEPEYQSIGGTAGPETIYELRYPFDVRRHVSASLLIGARYCERFFSGFGPTLLIGSGGGALTQWDIVPVAYTPTWARGLYVTPSVGLRVVKYATDVNSGSRVPAAGTADVAKPPALGRTDSRPVVVLSLGIGFDLSVVGAAADSLLTSMGAK